MTSCTLTASLSQPAMMCDRMELDAARALLGVSPSGSSSSSSTTSTSARVATFSIYSAALQVEALDREITGENEQQQQQQQGQQHHENEQLHWRTAQTLSSDRDSQDQQPQQPTNGLYEQQLRLEESPENEMHTTAIAYKRPRSDSAGLEALAALATKETSLRRSDSPLAPFLVSHSNLSSEDSDADACSDSNEGMPPPPPRRRRRSASNPEGMEKWDSLKRNHQLSTGRRHFVLPASILEEELQAVSAAMQERELAGLSNGTGSTTANIPRSIPEDEELADKSSSNEDGKEEEEVDEASLTPEELLRRARSRLLEDLSEGSVNGEKGVVTLPHSLSKYKEVYNKNGRIGIYTPAERAAIIAKFNSKRTRRVWNKKIRYNCRKSLADRRLRVKGRFVKRSEQEQMAKELAKSAAKKESGGGQQEEEDDEDNDNEDADKQEDELMPDVNDPEAGFSPTEDQPYRRLRRHTIT